jgi:hypothetical protein
MSKKSKRKKTPRKRQVKSSKSKKGRILILVVILVAAGSYFFYFKNDRNPYAYRSDKTPIDIEALKGGETGPTLSPVLFVGNVAKAYNTTWPDKIGNCWTACIVTVTVKKISGIKAF